MILMKQEELPLALNRWAILLRFLGMQEDSLLFCGIFTNDRWSPRRVNDAYSNEGQQKYHECCWS